MRVCVGCGLYQASLCTLLRKVRHFYDEDHSNPLVRHTADVPTYEVCMYVHRLYAALGGIQCLCQRGVKWSCVNDSVEAHSCVVKSGTIR